MTEAREHVAFLRAQAAARAKRKREADALQEAAAKNWKQDLIDLGYSSSNLNSEMTKKAMRPKNLKKLP